jgi:hypothetical protein
MRLKKQDVVRDGNGLILSGAVISVYLSGTTTPASIYVSATSTAVVNSVTSGIDGTFIFYVDAFDYGSYQTFKYVISSDLFAPYTVDNILIDEVVLRTYTISTAKTAPYPVKIPKGVLYLKSGSGTLTFSSEVEIGQYQVFSGFTKGVDVTFSVAPLVVWDIWYDGSSTTETLTASTGTITTLTSTTEDLSGYLKTDTINEHTADAGVTIDTTKLKDGYISDSLGANVTSASTIAPTGSIFHVTGTAAIATISLPFTGFVGSIKIIPDGAFTWTTAGNIAVIGTATVGQAIIFSYDSTTTKWYPSSTLLTASNLSMTGEVSAKGATTDTLLDLGSVTSGDRIFVSGQAYLQTVVTPPQTLILQKSSGTATIVSFNSQTTIHASSTSFTSGASVDTLSVSGVFQVTGNGTLVLKSTCSTATIILNEIYAFFLKKQ